MDEDVWEEIRYYEGERDDAITRRDELDEEIDELNKKHKKNKELTDQYNKLVSKLNLAQVELTKSEKDKTDALSNLNNYFVGVAAQKISKQYNTAFNNLKSVNKNLGICKTEANSKLKKLSSEKKWLEKQLSDKKDERNRENHLIDYYNRKLDSLY